MFFHIAYNGICSAQRDSSIFAKATTGHVVECLCNPESFRDSERHLFINLQYLKKKEVLEEF